VATAIPDQQPALAEAPSTTRACDRPYSVRRRGRRQWLAPLHPLRCSHAPTSWPNCMAVCCVALISSYTSPATAMLHWIATCQAPARAHSPLKQLPPLSIRLASRRASPELIRPKWRILALADDTLEASPPSSKR